MLLSDEIKWIAGAAIAIALILGGYKLYNLGWDAHAAKVTSDNNIAIKAAVEQAKLEWQSTQQITSVGMRNVNDTKQKLEVVVRQSPSIQAPLCTDVGSDYIRVYNSAIGTIKAGANQGGRLPATEMPAKSVGGATGVNPTGTSTTKGNVSH